MRRLAVVLAPVALVFAFAAAAAGCKQGLGEKCQTSDDCADGLTCVTISPNSPIGSCMGKNTHDSGVISPDASDGGTTDAPVDAGVDAMPDA